MCNHDPSNSKKINSISAKETRRLRQANSRRDNSHPKPTGQRLLHLQQQHPKQHLPPASDAELWRVYTLLRILVGKPVTLDIGHEHRQQRSVTKAEHWRTGGETNLRRCMLRHTKGISLGLTIRRWSSHMAMAMMRI
jgi:hypothetical protein